MCDVFFSDKRSITCINGYLFYATPNMHIQLFKQDLANSKLRKKVI